MPVKFLWLPKSIAPKGLESRPKMAHGIAKLLLEHADTVLDRQQAIKTALTLGMPLHEIEEYLDWVDMMRSARSESCQSDSPEAENEK
jgi:hypothetical protein